MHLSRYKQRLIYQFIHKIALYEPPLYIDHSLVEKYKKVMDRFDKEIADDEIAAALVTVLKGLGIMPLDKNVRWGGARIREGGGGVLLESCCQGSFAPTGLLGSAG